METITRNKRFQLLLAMLLAATFSVAQQTVIVKDSITNEPISFVSVYWGNNSGGYTDEKGAIAIPNEAAQIHLSHICYETKSIDNKDHRSGIEESKDADQAQGYQWI